MLVISLWGKDKVSFQRESSFKILIAFQVIVSAQTLSLGNFSFSSNKTFLPFLAKNKAHVVPAGPAPQIIASNFSKGTHNKDCQVIFLN